MKLRLRRTRPGALAASRFAILFGCAVLAACGAPETTADRVLVYDFDEATRTYGLAPVTLRTLTSLDRIEGEFTTVLGGSDIVLDVMAALEENPWANEDAPPMYVRGGRPIEARYLLQDGVAIPEDFNTLALLTWYRHIERTADFLHGHGLSAAIPGHKLTHHLPTVSVLVVAGQPLLSDNAGFSAPLGGFALFPRHLLTEQTPLAMNLGVVAHEYGHAVIHGLVSGEATVPREVAESWPGPAANAFGATHEGFADVIAGLVTDDPDFMRASLPDYVADDRILTRHRELTSGLVKSLADGDALTFNPYAVGSVIASALWRLREPWGRDQLARVAIDALEGLGARIGPEYELAWLSAELYEATPAGERGLLCDVLGDARWPLPPECGE